MEQDDFLARKEQILNRNSAKNFKEFNIENELKKLPAKPGVYLMHDASDEIIYVGKAIKLCNRVRQYFQRSKKPSAKIEQMVSHVSYFEYIVTDSEMEALILECNLIKKYRPKYNILLRDDKHIRISRSRMKSIRVSSRPGSLRKMGAGISGLTAMRAQSIRSWIFSTPVSH